MEAITVFPGTRIPVDMPELPRNPFDIVHALRAAFAHSYRTGLFGTERTTDGETSSDVFPKEGFPGFQGAFAALGAEVPP